MFVWCLDLTNCVTMSEGDPKAVVSILAGLAPLATLTSHFYATKTGAVFNTAFKLKVWDSETEADVLTLLLHTIKLRVARSIRPLVSRSAADTAALSLNILRLLRPVKDEINAPATLSSLRKNTVRQRNGVYGTTDLLIKFCYPLPQVAGFQRVI